MDIKSLSGNEKNNDKMKLFFFLVFGLKLYKEFQ